MIESLHAYRAALLWFAPADLQPAQAQYESDGLLVVQREGSGTARVRAIGSWASLRDRFADVPTTHWPGRIIAPGFVDLHIHYPQTFVIGSPAEGLLPWLENYTFPAEAAFADPQHCAEVASFFVDELLRQGVTTALAFATSHPHSVDALMLQAQRARLRMIAGMVLMDRHAPANLVNRDGVGGRTRAAQSIVDTEALISRWHGHGRLGYAITPRFAPTSTEEQLRGAGELAAAHPDVWIQSHVAENHDEIRWVRELFPAARSYLSVYDEYQLLRERAVYAHCIHFDGLDRALMRERGSAAAVSPTSNLFLGSGFFDYAAADATGFMYGLASDVGGGTSFSPFHTMLAAYYVGREGASKQGLSLTPVQLWWQHTAGAARALGLDGVAGNLLPGCDADFVVINLRATPLVAQRTAQARNLDELLFALIVLGDDRLIEQTCTA